METRSSPSSARNGQFHERKRNGRSHTNERGCCTILSISLSLFLSFRSTRDSNLTRIHPLPPQTRSFLRSRDRSFVRSFLEPRQARLETLLVRRCTPAVGGWQFREADSANEKLVGFDIRGEGRGEREERLDSE